LNRKASQKHALVWTLILSATLGFARAQAQVGFSHRSGSLFRLDLVTDSSPIVPAVVGETGIPGYSGSMALGPDGRLYAAHRQWPQPDRLYAIDPATAEATLIGDLDLGDAQARWSDMTFDDQGRLWLLSMETLFRIDPATAAAIEIATGLEGLQTVAHRNGVLYGVAGDAGVSEWSLVSIDPTTGDLTPLADITGIESVECLLEIPESADFDAAGGLWISVDSVPACIVPDFNTWIVYLPDALQGTPTSRSRVDGPGWFPALALAPRQEVIAVPTLDLSGFLLLSLALAATALALLRRRSAG